jgi:hypothetical protein
MDGPTALKLSKLLENITHTPELIKALKEDDVLTVLYKNGISLNPTEVMVLADIVKNTYTTFMAHHIQDLRAKWADISKDS